jgi:hypothetical protein
MKAPAADRKVLVLVAGAVWSIVGIALVIAAVGWTVPVLADYHLLWLGAGVIGGYIIHRFGFSRLVTVNIQRIFSQSPGKDKVCVFSFQNTKSYIMIIVMILMGYTLRHLPIPRLYLSPVYSAVGIALLLSSLMYYRRLRYRDIP